MIELFVWLAMLVATRSVEPQRLPDILPPLVANPCAPAFMCGYHVR